MRLAVKADCEVDNWNQGTDCSTLVAAHNASLATALQVERLLEHGTCVDQQDDYGETALHLACMAGHIDVVRILVVEHQAKLDIQNWEGWAPIIWAVVHGHIAVVKFLQQRVCFCTLLTVTRRQLQFRLRLFLHRLHLFFMWFCHDHL